MNAKLNKSELKKMLSELQSELKIVTNQIKHSTTEKNSLQLHTKKKIDKINVEINSLSLKKSLITDNIGKLNSLISASDKI